MDPSTTPASDTFEFGRFRLLPAQALLLDRDIPCRLGARAMAILVALVEHAGETLTKQTLSAGAWPGVTVHEANLRMHVGALRKVLGEGQGGGEGSARYIASVSGRGYCFVAPVRRVEARRADPPARQPSSHPHNLPARLTRVVGRAQAVETIALQAPMRRCVTVVGPAGIGKTSVAVAAAERLLPIFDDGAWFVDLAAIMEPDRVTQVMAAVLGLSLQSANPLPGLIGFLRDKRLLLVLDNCEHVIEAVAQLAERILRDAPHVGLLATSREALRVNGEWVHRLGPIEAPPADVPLTAAQALAYPAVQLFVECATASLDGFRLRDLDVPAVVELCRRLDGLPLAIELAAARIDTFGLAGLAHAFDDRFLLVVEGRRTAMPRQQSLTRALEWSYRLLSPVEQTILRRLSVFRRDFTLSAAVAVAGGDGIEPDLVYAAVLTLSAKSLVATDVSDDLPQHHHRLLHVTRAFASQKLHDSGETCRIDRAHATYLCRLLGRAATDWETMARPVWSATYARAIDDVRAALDWAFGRDGDAATGVALTALALPLGFQLSLIDEFRGRVERALLHSGRIAPPQPLAEMRLNIALGNLTHNTSGPVPGRTVGIDRAIALSRTLDRPVYRVEPLIGLATLHLGTGEYAAAGALASRADEIAAAAADPMAQLAADRIGAQTSHFLGEHATARQLARRVIAHPADRLPLAYNLMPVSHHVAMRIVLARIAWLQGLAAEADALVAETLVRARADSAFSLCPALAHAAIPIAIWTGQDDAAAGLTALLADHAARYTLAYWAGWATGFRRLLRTRAGERAEPAVPSGALQTDTFATFSVALLTPAAAMRADSGACGWCQPEIRRVQGEWLLAEGAPGSAEAAETLFQDAIAVARQQGALAWELRAVTSLARLWQQAGRARAARDILAAILDRFLEGHATADLTAAAALLDTIDRCMRGHASKRRPAFL